MRRIPIINLIHCRLGSSWFIYQWFLGNGVWIQNRGNYNGNGLEWKQKRQTREKMQQLLGKLSFCGKFKGRKTVWRLWKVNNDNKEGFWRKRSCLISLLLLAWSRNNWEWREARAWAIDLDLFEAFIANKCSCVSSLLSGSWENRYFNLFGIPLRLPEQTLPRM